MVCKWSDAYTAHLTPTDAHPGRSAQPAFRNHLGHANNLLMRAEFDKRLLRFQPAQGVTVALSQPPTDDTRTTLEPLPPFPPPWPTPHSTPLSSRASGDAR